MVVCQLMVVTYAVESPIRPITIVLNSYDEIPDELAPNTVYVFPTDTMPDKPTIPPQHLSIRQNSVTRTKDEPTEVWSIFEKGRYYFAGSATTDDLYTSYRFTSRTKYTVYVNNLRNSAQTVNCYRSQYNSLFETFEVPAKSSIVTTVDAGYATWFLGFPKKCNVEGYVE
jgi:hypothetical protein